MNATSSVLPVTSVTTQFNEPLSTARITIEDLSGFTNGLSDDKVEAVINMAHLKTQEVRKHSYWNTYARGTALYKDENEDTFNDFDPVEITMGFIELLLAKHYCTIFTGGQAQSIKADGFAINYGVRDRGSRGFTSTDYGLQAIGLDKSGTLVNEGKPKASLYV